MLQSGSMLARVSVRSEAESRNRHQVKSCEIDNKERVGVGVGVWLHLGFLPLRISKVLVNVAPDQ